MGRNKGNLRVNCSSLIEGDVGIPDLLSRRSTQFSGTQQRRAEGPAAGREARGSKHNTVQSVSAPAERALVCYWETQFQEIMQILKFSWMP